MGLFGTDGIRGTANTYPMTAEIALKLGQAAGIYFNRANTLGANHRHLVVIAKDTRLSGYMVEPALTSGFISAGMDVILVGPLPTPAVAMLVKSLRADLGVMISASHNPYADNGIKLFGPDGYKLSDMAEKEIEGLVSSTNLAFASPDKLGRARRLEDARGRYIEFAKSTFPKSLTLEGLTIVLDCAHGAAYQVGPMILSELGAKIIALGVEPDGFNINHECGSTHPQTMCEMVKKTGASLGIALDGDADRVILCDEKGQILDGDQMMAMIGEYWHKKGLLKGKSIVATLMSNMGLERFFEELGLSLARTRIGDRYVVEKMRQSGCNIGGEQSGHMILSDYSTTGDGLIAALQVLAVMLEDGKPLSESGRKFQPLPQLLKNVRYEDGNPLMRDKVKASIQSAEKALGNHGRILVRPSGTEKLIRVMLEGENADHIKQLADEICDAISASGKAA